MLKAVGISKKFGENTVLENFTHEFKEGKVTAVLGRSGSGKSTLLNILMGLQLPDRGEIIRSDDQRIGAVFQENRLCENLTAAANIRLVTGKRLSKEQIVSELSAVGLSDCANKPVRTLSGGMKRRTALLRALLADCGVLFLDEPFKGLDADTKAFVLDYCQKKFSGKTVILVTHDERESKLLSDDIIML